MHVQTSVCMCISSHIVEQPFNGDKQLVSALMYVFACKSVCKCVRECSEHDASEWIL